MRSISKSPATLYRNLEEEKKKAKRRRRKKRNGRATSKRSGKHAHTHKPPTSRTRANSIRTFTEATTRRRWSWKQKTKLKPRQRREREICDCVFVCERARAMEAMPSNGGSTESHIQQRYIRLNYVWMARNACVAQEHTLKMGTLDNKTMEINIIALSITITVSQNRRQDKSHVFQHYDNEMRPILFSLWRSANVTIIWHGCGREAIVSTIAFVTRQVVHWRLILTYFAHLLFRRHFCLCRCARRRPIQSFEKYTLRP